MDVSTTEERGDAVEVKDEDTAVKQEMPKILGGLNIILFDNGVVAVDDIGRDNDEIEPLTQQGAQGLLAEANMQLILGRVNTHLAAMSQRASKIVGLDGQPAG